MELAIKELVNLLANPSDYQSLTLTTRTLTSVFVKLCTIISVVLITI